MFEGRLGVGLHTVGGDGGQPVRVAHRDRQPAIVGPPDVDGRALRAVETQVVALTRVLGTGFTVSCRVHQ